MVKARPVCCVSSATCLFQPWVLYAGIVAAMGIEGVWVRNAFNSNLVSFFTLIQVANGEASIRCAFCIGGPV
jgi:hypothetical protein